MSQPTRKPRRKIRVRQRRHRMVSVDQSGSWVRSNRRAEDLSFASKTRFSGLDFDSDSDSEGSSAAEEQTAAAQEVKEEFRSSDFPAIKLTIREKSSDRMAEWKKMRAEK